MRLFAAVGRAVVAVWIAAMLAGCAGWSSAPSLTVHVTSSTDRPLLIYVNGDWVGTIPARAGAMDVPAAGHNGPPWTVEARTDTGRVLGTLDVSAAQAADPAGVASDATLKCGNLRLAVGTSSVASGAAVSGQVGAGAPSCD